MQYCWNSVKTHAMEYSWKHYLTHAMQFCWKIYINRPTSPPHTHTRFTLYCQCYKLFFLLSKTQCHIVIEIINSKVDLHTFYLWSLTLITENVMVYAPFVEKQMFKSNLTKSSQYTSNYKLSYLDIWQIIAHYNWL